jgi:acyl CoA:acetate/3-ketoacid CoA transferase beta subunit
VAALTNVTTEFTTKELMAAFVASEIEDSEAVSVGASLPVCRAGILLAHLTHAPNLKVQMSFTMTNLRNVEVLESFEYITDWRAARWAEFFYAHDTGPDLYKRRRKAVFFIGGLQIDAYGNTNLIGIGNDFNRLKMRGPGGVGTASMGTNVGRYYLYVNTHNKQTLTERARLALLLRLRRGRRRRPHQTRPARRRSPLLHHAAVHLRLRGTDQADADQIGASRHHSGAGACEHGLRASRPRRRPYYCAADRGTDKASAHAHRRRGCVATSMTGPGGAE